MKGNSNKMIQSFEDLVVWQQSHQLMIDVYGFVKYLPLDERYNRRDQLIRSATSVPANISEGFGRFHYQENLQYCRQARGSLVETKNHVLAARDLKQAPIAKCGLILDQCDYVLRLLNGYIYSTKKLLRAKSKSNVASGQ